MHLKALKNTKQRIFQSNGRTGKCGNDFFRTDSFRSDKNMYMTLFIIFESLFYLLIIYNNEFRLTIL